MYNVISSIIIACTIVCNIPLALTSGGTSSNIFDTAKNGLYDVAQSIFNTWSTGVDDIFNLADSWVTKASSLLPTPSVNYCNDYVTVNNDYISQYVYNKNLTTNNNNYSMTVDNRVYNPITNNYMTVNNHKEYKTYNFYEDNNYEYITNNNYTNYEFLILNKTNNECRYYSYYYNLPNGSNSYNLTKEDIFGQYMIYDLYNYDSVPEDENLLGLWHLDGLYDNEVTSSAYTLSYNSNTFVNGRFNSGILLNGSQNMTITGNMPTQYTIEFWFYNDINNGTYTETMSANTWHHIAKTYDNGTIRCFIDGIEQSIGTSAGIPYRYYDDFASAYYTTNKAGVKLYNWLNISISVPNNIDKIRNYSNTKINFTSSHTTYGTFDPRGNAITQTSAKFASTSYTIPNLNCNNYYPLLNSTGVEFGYTSNQPITSYYISAKGRSDTSNSSDYAYRYISCYPNVTTGVDNRNYSSINFCNMSTSIIDEIRLTNGLLYTVNFSVPNQAFTFGRIWTAPSGSNYKVGDVALQTSVNITQYRIGGADYSYPQDGSVYIGLDGSKGAYAKVYNNGTWYPCDFGIWNGSEWANGVGFDFKSLTWGTDSSSIDISIITNYFGDGKEETKTITGFISNVAKFIPWIIDLLVFFLPLPAGLKALIIGLVTILGSLITLKFIRK